MKAIRKTPKLLPLLLCFLLVNLLTFLQVGCDLLNPKDPSNGDPPASVTFDPPAGTYAAAQSVFLNCVTADATIYYTTDNIDPTTASNIYSSPITVDEDMTLKARAWIEEGGQGAVSTAAYTITQKNIKKILYTHQADGSMLKEIYMMDSDGQNKIPLTSFGKKCRYPAWSPDGTRIVFVSDKDGSDFEIYTMDWDGSNVRQITNDVYDDYDPAWSADGTQIAFVNEGTDGDESFDIYVMNAEDGSGKTRLTFYDDTPFGSAIMPCWSPDGNKIAFAAREDSLSKREIFVMNTDGSNITRLTFTPDYSDNDPIFSPDGTQIVYCTDDIGIDGDFDIWLMDADGGNKNRIHDVSHDDTAGGVDWSPDGSKIVFDCYKESAANYDLYIMNADGSEVTPLTNTNDEESEPSWTH